MKLRNIFTWTASCITAIAFNNHVEAQNLDAPKDSLKINGIARTVLEVGPSAKNLLYPELVLNAQKGKWRAEFSADIYNKYAENPNGDYGVRPFFATIAYNRAGFTYKAGLLQPFTQRLSGTEFVNNMPSGLLGDKLTVQGGITGAQIDYKHRILPKTDIKIHGIAGTKIQDFSQFSSQDGPGFNAAIWALGTEISHETNANTSITVLYNYTHFGSGANNQEQSTHHLAAYATKKYGEMTFMGLGQIENGLTKNRTESYELNETNYVLLFQADGPLSKQFGWRAILGTSNLNATQEAYITFKKNNFAAQAGIANSNEDTINFNLTLVHSFK